MLKSIGVEDKNTWAILKEDTLLKQMKLLTKLKVKVHNINKPIVRCCETRTKRSWNSKGIVTNQVKLGLKDRQMTKLKYNSA